MNSYSIAVSPGFLTAAAFFLLGLIGRNLTIRLVMAYHGLRALTYNRALLAKARADFQKRQRGKIVTVGWIEKGPDGREHPMGFELQATKGVPVECVGPDGEYCRAGYTHAELVEIAKRGKEFAT